ncbi:hypothetical protein STTU_1291 [Streptomyces sp. Tu6071]|nr:hypothetical protein STTU_1291 [Streptomyces sp. Tu6071]
MSRAVPRPVTARSRPYNEVRQGLDCGNPDSGTWSSQLVRGRRHSL